MSNHYRIDAATVADVPDLLRLIRALADYEKLSDQVVATEADLRDSLFGKQAVGECLLARVDGHAIGMAVFFRNFSTFLGKPGLYLEDLFVDPGFRGTGIGRALLRAVAGIAVQRGYKRMDWSVLDWNEPAIGFYKSFGAQAIDEWTIFRLSGEALTHFANGAGATKE